ncbi:MAG: methyl-accepting chemotaxis protein, partial [Congregibacter sp.]|nr:methyl-accepting chemotaxis protein [Congregibacter sp.]
IVTPIRTAADAAERVAAGDLTFEVKSASSDELGRLLASIAKMVERLGGLIGRVKDSGTQLSATAVEIMESANQQETVSASFGATSGEIAAAVNQIAGTSAALLDTMEQVAAS